MSYFADQTSFTIGVHVATDTNFVATDIFANPICLLQVITLPWETGFGATVRFTFYAVLATVTGGGLTKPRGDGCESGGDV